MKINIKEKFIAGIIIFFLLFGSIAAITIYNRRLLYTGEETLIAINNEMGMLADISMDIHKLPIPVIHYLGTNDKGDEARYKAILNDIRNNIKTLKSMKVTTSFEMEWLNDAENEIAALDSEVNDIFRKHWMANDLKADKLTVKIEDAATTIAEKYIRRHQLFDKAEIEAAARQRQKTLNHVDVVLITGGAVAFVVGIIMLIYFSRTIISPLRRLAGMAKNISGGDFSSRMEINTGDEIEDVANEFNNMAGRIEEDVSRLSRQKALLEGIVDAMPFRIHVVDRDLNVVAWNSRREQGAFAARREDVIGKNIWHALDMSFPNASSARDRDEIKTEFAEVFKTGRKIEKEEVSGSFEDKRFFKIAKIPLIMSDDGVGYVVTVLEDVTERRLLEMRVMARERLAAAGQLAAGVAHEVNNPLASMAVCAESLIKRLGPENFKEKDDYERFVSYLKIIEAEIYRCKRITTDLLDFSKERSLVVKDVNINRVAAETVKLLQYQQKYKGFIVKMDFEDNLPDIPADEGQLRQVFLSIITNAFEAMEPGGLLNISTANNTDNGVRAIRIKFQDNGCGIPKENTNRIFEAFWTTKGHDGTGLGLSICHGIVSLHGGSIEVESEVGKGSAFTVIFPVVPLQKI
ncbi:MAG: HAMP domain-containing protein [Deltaproteobacteria bacterium]|nr:HAMP domain-containing protein [Deltaproteobacteria bacterium]